MYLGSFFQLPRTPHQHSGAPDVLACYDSSSLNLLASGWPLNHYQYTSPHSAGLVVLLRIWDGKKEMRVILIPQPSATNILHGKKKIRTVHVFTITEVLEKKTIGFNNLQFVFDWYLCQEAASLLCIPSRPVAVAQKRKQSRNWATMIESQNNLSVSTK